MARTNDGAISDMIGMQAVLLDDERLTDEGRGLVGKPVVIVMGPDSDGDVQVQFVNGDRCAWPADALDRNPDPLTGEVILEVDVNSLESVFAALNRIIGLALFVGSHVKVAAYVQDQRSDSSGGALGDRTTVALLRAARFGDNGRAIGAVQRRQRAPGNLGDLLSQMIGGDVIPAGDECNCESCRAARAGDGETRH